MSAPLESSELRCPGPRRYFEHFPDDPALRDFDPSDQKFAAMARRPRRRSRTRPIPTGYITTRRSLRMASPSNLSAAAQLTLVCAMSTNKTQRNLGLAVW